MATDPSLNWQLIEERFEECSKLNEQLGTYCASISDSLNKSARNRSSLENGTLAVDSQDWINCRRYADEIDQWIHHNIEWMKGVDEKITPAFMQLQKEIEQEIRSLLMKVNEWKSAQRLSILGGPADNIEPGLNSLAQWFGKTEKAVESFSLLISQYAINIRDMANWCNVSQITLTVHTEKTNLCAQMQEYIRRRKHLLVHKSFVVFEQPPVIARRSAAPDTSKTKKNSKIPFDLELRVLAGGLRGSSVEVEILLISEKQAQDIAKKNLDPLQEKLSTPGSLLAPRVILQAPNELSDGQTSAVFRGVRVQSMCKRQEDDTDVKVLIFDGCAFTNSFMLFSVSYHILQTGRLLLYHILFRTKPFQSCHGGAAIGFWVSIKTVCNISTKYVYPSMQDETSLATVTHSGKDGNEIRWQEFFPAIDLWFRNTTHCQEGLKIHWQYIADKLTISPNPEALISWDAFCKRKIGECQLTFWEWLCPIADYLAKMPAYWDSGLILGFVTRLAAEHLLSQATLPSMVLRFSESNPGKMVVSYIIPQENIMEHVLFDEEENKALEGKTLAECIRLSQDLQHIQYIMPINKHIRELLALDALSGHQATESSPSRSGYVRPRVALVWREPPVPPECLLNSSMDSSYYDLAQNSASSLPNRTASSVSECLSQVEFEEASRNLSGYLLNDLAMDDFRQEYGATNERMWT